MKIKIKGKKYDVYRLSEMTFSQFNEIVINNKVNDLPSYISAITSMDIEDVMESEVQCASIPYLYSFIFDVDVDQCITSKREVFKYEDKAFFIDNLSVSTFGKTYVIDLKMQGKSNFYEKSIYILAVALSKDSNTVEIEKIFNNLKQMRWVDIMPPAFFLLKNILKKRRRGKISLILFILELKKISSRIRLCLKKYKALEKKSYRKTYVRNLMLA